MTKEAIVLVMLIGAISLGGCVSDSGDDRAGAFDCKTHEWDLFITNTNDATVPLYTLNNGEDTQRVVAMGFQAEPGGEENLDVPNPTIRALECDTIILNVHNLNAMEHTLHLHGGLQDWLNDGVPFLSQMPIHNGETFTYVFEDLKAGTYWYHCHVDPAHHIDLGMYGAFIVEEREPPIPTDGEFVLMLDEWDNCHIHGGLSPERDLQRETGNYAAGDADCFGRKFQDYFGTGGPVSPMDANFQALCENPDIPQEVKDEIGCGHGEAPANREPRSWWYTDHPPYIPEYNTYTINGKAFPDTHPIYFEDGDTYRMRLINVGNEWHSMHIHGHKMLVAYRDGYELDHKFYVDTLSIGPGERYDVIIEADNPGFWMFHDHNGHAGTNDHQDPGGMMTIIAYTGEFARDIGFDPEGMERAIEVNDWVVDFHENGHDGHGTHLTGQRLTAGRDAMGLRTYS